MTDFVDIYVSALLFFVLSIHICLGKMTREVPVLVIRALFVGGVIFETVALGLFLKWFKYDYAVHDPESANWLSSERNNPYSDGIHQLIFISNCARYTVLGLTMLTFLVAELGDACNWSAPSALKVGGCLVEVIMRLYVLCFSVLIPCCGMVVMEFYRPDEPPSALDFSFMVGQECDGVQGVASSSLLDKGAHHCVSEFIYAKTEDDNANFFTTYVTVLIFYTLMIVDSVDFIEHDLWRPRVKAFTGFCIIVEVVVFFVTIVETQKLLDSHATDHDAFAGFDLENNTPLFSLTNGLITNLTLIRLTAITFFYIIFLRASLEKQCLKLNIFLRKAGRKLRSCFCRCCSSDAELV